MNYYVKGQVLLGIAFIFRLILSNILGNRIGDKPPPIETFSEIRALIQRSKSGLQDWSLVELTIGMYAVYLQQSSRCPADDVKGEQIFSESTVIITALHYLELFFWHRRFLLPSYRYNVFFCHLNRILNNCDFSFR